MNLTRIAESRNSVVAATAGGVASGLAVMVAQQWLEPDRTLGRAFVENGFILLFAGLSIALVPLANKWVKSEKLSPAKVAALMIALAQVLVMGTMMLSESVFAGAMFAPQSLGLMLMTIPAAALTALLGCWAFDRSKH